MNMKNDPRRPENIILFKNCVANTGEAPPDWYSFIAVVFAMIGFMMRLKWGSWCALLTLICGYSSSRSSTTDWTQMFTTFTMIMIGFVTNYMAVFNHS